MHRMVPEQILLSGHRFSKYEGTLQEKRNQYLHSCREQQKLSTHLLWCLGRPWDRWAVLLLSQLLQQLQKKKKFSPVGW